MPLNIHGLKHLSKKMKILLYGLLCAVIISLASVYIFVSNPIIVSKAETIESSERIISQHINERAERVKWWPEKSAVTEDVMFLNGLEYKFKASNLNLNEISIRKGDFETKSLISWQVVSKNTLQISWRTAIPPSYNPITRFLQYQNAREVKKNMDIILESLLNYVVQSKNVYGFDIKRSLVKDTLLASSSMIHFTSPETRAVYSLIDSVKRFVANNNLKQVNPPMLNVFKDEKGNYQTIVALPVNREFKSTGNIEIKKMVPGNILEMTVKGGPKTIEKGFNQIKMYVNDFQLISPAMPFESLITDRAKQPDTSKWVTKIYYPIF